MHPITIITPLEDHRHFNHADVSLLPLTTQSQYKGGDIILAGLFQPLAFNACETAVLNIIRHARKTGTKIQLWLRPDQSEELQSRLGLTLASHEIDIIGFQTPALYDFFTPSIEKITKMLTISPLDIAQIAATRPLDNPLFLRGRRPFIETLTTLPTRTTALQDTLNRDDWTGFYKSVQKAGGRPGNTRLRLDFRRAQMRLRERLWSAPSLETKIKEFRSHQSVRSVNLPHPLISFIAPTKRPQFINSIIDKIRDQNIRNCELIIVIHGHETHFKSADFLAPDLNLKILNFSAQSHNVGRCMNDAIQIAKGDYIVKIDDDDYYGPLYTQDILRFMQKTDLDFSGRPPFAAYLQGRDKTYIRNAGILSEYSFCTLADLAERRVAIMGCAQVGTRDFFINHPYDEDNIGSVDTATFERHKLSNAKVAVLDGFNIIIHRNHDKAHHTWKITDKNLARNALPIARKLATDLIYT